MPKPASIIHFERFFWASEIIGWVSAYFAWPNMQAALEQSGSPYGMTAVVIILVIASLIIIGFWYGIAKRGSNVMRWVYIVWMGLSSLATLFSLVDPQTPKDTALIFSLASTALTVASIVCLFRRDAVAWLKGKPAIDPEIFQ